MLLRSTSDRPTSYLRKSYTLRPRNDLPCSFVQSSAELAAATLLSDDCWCSSSESRPSSYSAMTGRIVPSELSSRRTGVVSGTATQMPKLPNYGNRCICPTVVALAEWQCARSTDTCPPLRRQIDRTRPDDLRHSNADSFSSVETSFSILLQQGGRLPSLRRVSPPIQLRVAFCWVHFSSQTSIRANMR